MSNWRYGIIKSRYISAEDKITIFYKLGYIFVSSTKEEPYESEPNDHVCFETSELKEYANDESAKQEIIDQLQDAINDIKNGKIITYDQQ